MHINNLIKRISTICFCILFIISSTVTIYAAAEYDWGPQYFTPYEGQFIAKTNFVAAVNMKWSESQCETLFLSQSTLAFSWLTSEFEFRPVSYSPHDIWDNESVTFVSNLPDSYYEFQDDDTDDIAVCSQFAAGYEEEKSYYGRLYFTELDDAPTDAQYIFESEHGQTVPLYDDSLPIAYEQYDLETTYMGDYYYW